MQGTDEVNKMVEQTSLLCRRIPDSLCRLWVFREVEHNSPLLTCGLWHTDVLLERPGWGCGEQLTGQKQRRTGHITSVTFPSNPQPTMTKTSDQCPLRDVLPDTPQVVPKSFKIIQNKGSLRTCHRQKETWPLNGWNPGKEKGHEVIT